MGEEQAASAAAVPAASAAAVRFRPCRPTDIPACAAIEAASYPAAEAAPKSALQYRQHHCSRYFRCAVVAADGGDGDDRDAVVGFVCSTRCRAFTHESMGGAHEATGRLLAIHSVVVREEFRGRGIATRMLRDYVRAVLREDNDEDPPEKLVLLAKANLLAFYVDCGFQVM